MARVRAGRLRPRPDGRHPRLPQRVRRAGVDAPPFRPGRTTRGLFRRAGRMGPERPAERRRGRRLLPPPRQRLGARARGAGAMKIRALIEETGKTAVGFAVPEDVVLGLGKGKRPPVNVTLNGY